MHKTKAQASQQEQAIASGSMNEDAHATESDTLQEARELTRLSANVANASSIAGGLGRASNIREKFEKGEMHEHRVDKPRRAKVRYAGVESARSRLMEEAHKDINGAQELSRRRSCKEITPPREGVTSGTLENEPQSRRPGVAGASDGINYDFRGVSNKAKNIREKFKNLEKIGQASFEEQKGSDIGPRSSVDSQVAVEATKNAKAKWKDIESGKVEHQIRKTPIDMKGPGGVYENEPKIIDGVIRHADLQQANGTLMTASAASRREAFLKSAAGESTVKRFDPAMELQELAKQEKIAIYENEPAARRVDVVASSDQMEDFVGFSTAGKLRQKFADINALTSSRSIKKTPIEMCGEGGIYENEPTQRDDVIHHNVEDIVDTSTVKWASEAKQRFMKEAEERSKVVKSSQPIISASDSITPSVYENEPVMSIADAKSNDTEAIPFGKYATTAKQIFLEKQREEEEAIKLKARPDIIDIWSEVGTESGVFENIPKERSSDIVVSGQYSDEEYED